MKALIGLAFLPFALSAVEPAAFFEKRCVQCHGPKKQKAKLRLDTLAWPALSPLATLLASISVRLRRWEHAYHYAANLPQHVLGHHRLKVRLLQQSGWTVVRVRRETKGRRGKTVTTISGVPLGPDALKELAGELKRRCGSGGSARDGVIEIQGDHVDLLLAELGKRGFTAKKSGG